MEKGKSLEQSVLEELDNHMEKLPVLILTSYYTQKSEIGHTHLRVELNSRASRAKHKISLQLGFSLEFLGPRTVGT